jgi:hypothetical protein
MMWVLIVLAVVVLITLAVNVNDIRRYLRMRRM